MRPIPSSLSLLSFVLLLSACAPMAPLPAEQTSNIKRVGVVSVVADQFTRQHVGITVFGNERDIKPITDWKVDQAYEDQLAAAVEQVGGMTVVRTKHATADFAPVNGLNGPWDAPAFWGPNWSLGEAPIKALCAAHSLDAVLLAARAKFLDPFGGTNQPVTGLGIYSRKGRGTMLHIVARVSLMDCKTGKPLITRTLERASGSAGGTSRSNVPTSGVEARAANSPSSQWPAEVEERVRTQLIALPGTAWSETLRTMLGRR